MRPARRRSRFLDGPTGEAVRRIALPLSLFGAVVGAGTLSYWSIGAGRWSVFECAYMTVTTVFAVGFLELPEMAEVPHARAFTIALVVGGVGALAYVQASITAFIVEGALGQALREQRMKKRIAELRDHVVIVGAGTTGRHVIEDVLVAGTAIVVVDLQAERLRRLAEDLSRDLLWVAGDATEDAVLLEAGVDRAAGVVAALTHDKDNLVVTLSARSLNPRARVVAKISEASAEPKMRKAGATSVVNPTMMGGHRLANEVLRPEVSRVLDTLLRSKDSDLKMDEIVVSEGSRYVGRALGETDIRRDLGLLVIAIRDADGDLVFNPDAHLRLESGMTLIVLGPSVGLARMHDAMS